MKEIQSNQSIQAELLDEGSHLALTFPRNIENVKLNKSTQRLMEFDVVFFEVQAWEDVRYKPLDLYDSKGNEQGPIGPQSGLDYSRLHNANGRDLASIGTNENPWLLTHFSFSVLEDDVRVYPKVSTETLPGWTWTNEADAKNGDEYGYYPGKELDYDSPSSALETVAFSGGDYSPVEFGFYNESTQRSVDPTLNVLGRTYRTAPVTDKTRQDKLIEKTALEDSTVKTVGYGPVTDSVVINLPDAWEEAGAVRQLSGPQTRSLTN
ncbi:hypothetical protein [Halomicrococcus sp. SG-WS-1]|uniref:hypothetical protein n=1 Tax=Halomicrococcus sp. SG-WS-1 TaxID=3439057 RepID=UPI003F798C05